MNRRTVLRAACSGVPIGLSGCLSSVREQSGPIDFGLLNYTADPHRVAVTIRDRSGNRGTVLDETYDIEGREKYGDRVAITEDGFADATNGDVFAVSVDVADVPLQTGQFEITCIENDDIRDALFADLRLRDDDVFVLFRESHCSPS